MIAYNKGLSLLLIASLTLTSVAAFRFEVTNKAPICIVENLPKNQELVSQIMVDPEAKNFAITVMHLNEKGKLVGSQKVKTYNMRDVYVHNEGRLELPQTARSTCVCIATSPSRYLLRFFQT